MRRAAVAGLALVMLGTSDVAGQILADADVEHFAGCFRVSASPWDLGEWAIEPDELPPLPAILRLRMTPVGPYPAAAQTRSHVISHTPVERSSDAYDSRGNRLSAFGSWRAPNPRSFSAGRIVEAPSVQLVGSIDDAGELRTRVVFLPPGAEIGPGFDGHLPGVTLDFTRVPCPQPPGRAPRQ